MLEWWIAVSIMSWWRLHKTWVSLYLSLSRLWMVNTLLRGRLCVMSTEYSYGLFGRHKSIGIKSVIFLHSSITISPTRSAGALSCWTLINHSKRFHMASSWCHLAKSEQVVIRTSKHRHELEWQPSDYDILSRTMRRFAKLRLFTLYTVVWQRS